MALLDSAELASDGTFRARVQTAIVAAALDIVGEDASANEAASLRRQSLAVHVLNGPDNFVSRFAWAVAANPAITPDSSDNDLAYTVTTVWSDLAGVVSAQGEIVEM